MPKPTARSPGALNRRRFLRTALLSGATASVLKTPLLSLAEDFVTMPFENGRRPLVKYPQKRPLIRLTTRPPQLETPFSVFNEGVITPNDAFFVRYHLTPPPLDIDPEKFRLQIKGKGNEAGEFSIADLKSKFEPVEIIAVNQ